MKLIYQLIRPILSSLPLFLLTVQLHAQTVQIGETTLTERDVITGLEVPWELTYGPDDHLWVTERRGRVLRIDPESGYATQILDLQATVISSGDTEDGLLGLALHPDFQNNPLVYLVYCYIPEGTFFSKERLVMYQWDGNMLHSEVVLLDDIPSSGVHNGSRILITDDQKILMTTGDAGNSGDAQDLEELTGKILRLNIDGTIPGDNPIPGSLIYSYGHRNPQGLAFGKDGQLYSTEHGAQSSDEFNLIIAGGNYGWPYVQGACDQAAELAFCADIEVVEPIREWSPCPAVNDIVYYDHPAIPGLQNSFLMAVLGGQQGGLERISQLRMNFDGSAVNIEQEYFSNFGRIRDVAINPHTGSIYFATNGMGYPGQGPNRIVEYANLDYNSIETLDRNLVKVFPNPVSDQLQAEIDPSLIGAQYDLHEANGQVIRSGKVEQSTLVIDVSAEPAGSYFLQVRDQKGRVSKLILIE